MFSVQPQSNLFFKFKVSKSYRSGDIVLTRTCFTPIDELTDRIAPKAMCV